MGKKEHIIGGAFSGKSKARRSKMRRFDLTPRDANGQIIGPPPSLDGDALLQDVLGVKKHGNIPREQSPTEIP